MSEEEKRQRLLSLGFDPSLYTYESDLAEQPSEVSQTPTKSVVSAKPSLVESFGGSLARGALPALAAGGTVAALGSALSATGIGAPIGIPITLAGAGLAGYGTRRLQEAVAPSIIPDYKETEQAQIQAHPYASLAGDITANLAGGLGPSIRNIPRAGRTLLDVARGITPEAADVSNLANVGIGAVLPPAQELAISGLTGEPLPSLSNLAISSAGGALFNRPNIIGRKLFRFPSTDITPYRFSPEEAAAAQQTGTPIELPTQEEQTPNIPGAKPNLFMDKLQEILSQTEEFPEKLKAQQDLQKSIQSAMAKSQRQAEIQGKQYKEEQAYDEQIQQIVDALKAQKSQEYTLAGKQPPPEAFDEITPEIVKKALGQPRLEVPLTKEDHAAKIVMDNLLPKEGIPFEVGKTPYTVRPGEFPVGNAKEILAQINPQEVASKTLSENSIRIIKDSLQKSFLEGQIPGHPPALEQPESPLGVTEFRNERNLLKSNVEELENRYRKALNMEDAQEKVFGLHSAEHLKARSDRLKLGKQLSYMYAKEAGKHKIEYPTDFPEVLNQPESTLREQLTGKQIPLNPTESWHDTFNKLAVARGIKLEKDFTLTSEETGKPIAGRAYVRQGLQEALAKVNPSLSKAGLDTWPHELFHIFYQDLLSSPNKFDNRIAQQGQLKAAQSEAYKKSGAISPHEFLTQNVGEGVVKHIFNTEGKSPLANWFSDFWSYIKARFAPGKATEADYTRLLTNKLLYDKARGIEAPKAETTSSEREKELAKLGKQTTLQQPESELAQKNIDELWRKSQETPEAKRLEELQNRRSRIYETPLGSEEIKNLTELDRQVAQAQAEQSSTKESKDWWEAYNQLDKINKTKQLQEETKKLNRTPIDITQYKSFEDRLNSFDAKVPVHGTDIEDLDEILTNGLKAGSALDLTKGKEWNLDYGASVVVPTARKGRKIEHNNFYNSANTAPVERVIINRDIYTIPEYTDNKIAELKAKHPNIPIEVYGQKESFEQPESPINPATGLTREEEQIIKERDIGTRVPADIMEFSRSPSNLQVYYKWLQQVKGLSREEAGDRIRELEKALGRTRYPNRPRGQFEDVVSEEELPPIERNLRAEQERRIAEQSGEVEDRGLEQPESPLKSEEERVEYQPVYTKEGEGIKIPKIAALSTMDFRSQAGKRLAIDYVDWLENVKGLKREEAAKIVNKFFEQSESLLANEESKLPEYKGKSSFFPFLTDRFSKVAEKFKTPLAQYVSDNLHRFSGEADYMQGQIGNKLVQFTKDFTPDSINKVYHYLHDIDDTGKSSFILSANEKTLANNITTLLRNLREQQIKMGIQVQFAKGKYRIAGIKPEGYIFNILDPKVPYTWAESPNSPQALAYDKAYIDHQVAHGLTPEEAQKALTEYKGALGNNVAREIEFGALRRAEGNGLPWSLVDQNFASASERYGRRAAKDLAYFKYIQNDPKMRSALGLKDQFGVPPDKIDPMASSREVQDALRSVFGIDIPRNPTIMATARLAANVVMGPGTAARNILNMPSFIAQYVQVPQIHLVGKAFANLNESRVRAFQANAVKTSFADFDAAGYYAGSPNPAINLLNKFAYYLRRYQGRDFSDKFEGSFYYSIGEQLAVDNIARAKLGNKESQIWVKKFSDIVEGDPLKKQITQDDIARIAKRFVDSARGTYGPEGLPSWSIEGEFAPFTALSRFAIEKSNTIWKDVVQPMSKGVYGPFLRYVFASFGVGSLISSLNDLLTHKRGQEPSLSEIQISKGIEPGIINLPETLLKDPGNTTAKAISLLQLASFAGSISDGAKLAVQLYKGKTFKYSNPLSFPLYTLATDTIGSNISDAIDAIHQGEDPFQVMGNLAVAMSTQSMQTMRYVDANFIHPEEAERKERFRDYKVFQELQGKQVQESPDEHADVLGNRERRDFKRTGDIQEAVQHLPSLLQKAFDNASKSGSLDIETLKSEWKKIKENNYQTMPDFNVIPGTFKKYLEYLTQSQGEDAARARFVDYVKQNIVNEIKSSFVPSL